jgi:WXG100 family type VII secretion target
MTIEVQHEAFRRGIADVRAATERLDTDERRIDTRVSGFLQSGWTGVAADSFVAAWEEWKHAADDVRDGLDAMGQLLDAAHRDLTVQDETSQAALDALSTRIVERLG